MDASARLGLPYLAAGQMQKHVTVNEALTRLDVLVQTRIISRTTTGQPATPGDGDLYILPVGASGSDWSGRASGDLVRADTGGWTVEVAPPGTVAVIEDENLVLVRQSGGWVLLGERLGQVQGLTRLGLNTTADAGNPFAARLTKALWTAPGGGEGGDLRMTFNKGGASDVLSLLFQSGWGGRAELGLIGDDDLTLKVSPDGGSWHEAMRVDGDTGAVVFAAGGGRAQTTIVTSDMIWTPPVWARRIEALIVGGGGGGGSGAAGPSGTARYGGGGGGAGALIRMNWVIEDLGGNLDIVIGAGGAGGSGVSSGSGNPGTDGQSTTISRGGVVILRGTGGEGGRGGTSMAGTAGKGGLGIGNPGGASAISATAETGRALDRPDGAGGGGGGGGLDAANTVRAGGAGGAGASLGAISAGGTGGVASVGAAGAVPAHSLWVWAGGGGGGGSAALTTGYAGGLGQTGAGGGGGGAGVSGSGTGGAGGQGVVVLTAIG